MHSRAVDAGSVGGEKSNFRQGWRETNLSRSGQEFDALEPGPGPDDAKNSAIRKGKLF